MSLAPGSRLGPYQIHSALGAGGMGEVWKARDERLERLVAIKVLPEHLASDPTALARFARESKALAALNHPNILGVFDVGVEGGTAYVVMELLEGETLRDRLARGPLHPRRALDIALQIARGLAAAHERGVIHRDLKPPNLWITRDGRAKLLDFGLAKLQPVSPATQTATLEARPDDHDTATGVVLGTVGYMSPEQARGEALDARTDIFSLGVVLWEMLSGRRPFQGKSAIETLNAILTQDPPDLDAELKVPPGLVRIVDHCLQKDPAARFQSASDLAFALESQSASSGSGLAPSLPRRGSWARRAAGGAVLLTLLGLGAGLLRSGRPAAQHPVYRRVTYRDGQVRAARFSADGHTIVFSATWEGSPTQVYQTRLGGADARPLGLPGAELLALSRTDNLALLTGGKPSPENFHVWSGTLSRVALAGGTPQPMGDGVLAADWSPDGTKLAVVRVAGARFRIEAPLGTVLLEGPERLSDLRFSPDGRYLACLRFPFPIASEAEVLLLDPVSKATRPLVSQLVSLGGLAWEPRGSEVWYTTFNDPRGNLHAVGLDGKDRVVASVPDDLDLQDIAQDGTVLTLHGVMHSGILAQASPAAPVRELGQYKWSTASSLSPDGTHVITSEDSLEPTGGVLSFLRSLDGSEAIPLPIPGDAWAVFGADRSDIVFTTEEAGGCRLGHASPDSGEPRSFLLGGMQSLMPLARIGNQALLVGKRGAAPAQMFLQPLDGGAPTVLLTLDSAQEWGLFGSTSWVVDPGQRFLVFGSPSVGYRRLELLPGASPTPIRGLLPNDRVIRWSGDGKSLLVSTSEEVPVPIERVDLATGARTRLRNFDPPGHRTSLIFSLLMGPDGQALVASYKQSRTNLYVVQGLH